MSKRPRSPAQLENDRKLALRSKVEAAKKLLAEAGYDINDAPEEKVFAAVEAVGLAPAPPNPRAPRSAMTREKTTRRKPWAPPSMLDAPPAPDGFCHRWLRAGMLGEEDKINMSKRHREGYEPVRGDEFPGYDLPLEEEGRNAGVFSVGGLILARIPEETVAERNEYYSNKTKNQMNAIDAELASHSNSAMPLGAPTRKSETTFGNPENKPEGT